MGPFRRIRKERHHTRFPGTAHRTSILNACETPFRKPWSHGPVQRPGSDKGSATAHGNAARDECVTLLSTKLMRFSNTFRYNGLSKTTRVSPIVIQSRDITRPPATRRTATILCQPISLTGSPNAPEASSAMAQASCPKTSAATKVTTPSFGTLQIDAQT